MQATNAMWNLESKLMLRMHEMHVIKAIWVSKTCCKFMRSNLSLWLCRRLRFRDGSNICIHWLACSVCFCLFQHKTSKKLPAHGTGRNILNFQHPPWIAPWARSDSRTSFELWGKGEARELDVPGGPLPHVMHHAMLWWVCSLMWVKPLSHSMWSLNVGQSCIVAAIQLPRVSLDYVRFISFIRSLSTEHLVNTVLLIWSLSEHEAMSRSISWQLFAML